MSKQAEIGNTVELLRYGNVRSSPRNPVRDSQYGCIGEVVFIDEGLAHVEWVNGESWVHPIKALNIL